VKITLGKKYKDKVHGIVGTATCLTTYLSGCDRVNLEYVKDGEIKCIHVDAPMLEAVPTAKSVKGPTEAKKRGGPRAMPPAKTIG
jgi:hypothetical protein